MINSINKILAEKNVSIFELYHLNRENESDTYEIIFSDITTGSKYYAKVNVRSQTIITFHKRVREKPRENRSKIKDLFWKKWAPTNFCVVDDNNQLKRQMLKDLDHIVENKLDKLDEIDWTNILEKRPLLDRDI